MLHSAFLVLAMLALASANTCTGIISSAVQASFEAEVASEAVLLIGSRDQACTNAGLNSLKALGACTKEHFFTDANDKLLDYLRCVHPETDGGAAMHSFVWIGGVFMGSGFKIDATHGSVSMAAETLRNLLDDTPGATRLVCYQDCAAEAQLSSSAVAAMTATVANSPVVLYGWQGCGCTRTAIQRFNKHSTCYAGKTWEDGSDPIFKFLQCRYGSTHNSFVFIGGNMIPGVNGFYMHLHLMPDIEMNKRFGDAQAKQVCPNGGPAPAPASTTPATPSATPFSGDDGLIDGSTSHEIGHQDAAPLRAVNTNDPAGNSSELTGAVILAVLVGVAAVAAVVVVRTKKPAVVDQDPDAMEPGEPGRLVDNAPENSTAITVSEQNVLGAMRQLPETDVVATDGPVAAAGSSNAPGIVMGMKRHATAGAAAATL